MTVVKPLRPVTLVHDFGKVENLFELDRGDFTRSAQKRHDAGATMGQSETERANQDG